LQALRTLTRCGRQEADEKRLGLVETGHRQCRRETARTGHRYDTQACRTHRLDDAGTGIRNGRCARVADERNAQPLLQQREHAFGGAAFVVFMRRDQACRRDFDAIAVEQVTRHACVLGRDRIDMR
jgi:hypothetical protein